MACFTCVAEKDWTHYHALSHSAIQTWLDGDSWDQVPKHRCGCHLGHLTPIPIFLPQSLVMFHFKAAISSCDGAEPVFVTVELWSQFELLCCGNIDNNQWCKRRLLQGKMNRGSIEGFIQSICAFLLVYTFPCPLNCQWMSQVVNLKRKQRCSEVESNLGSMMNY